MMSCTRNLPYHMELIGFALSLLCRVGRVLALRRAKSVTFNRCLSMSTQVTLNPGLSSLLQSTLYSAAGRDLGGVAGSIGGISPVR